MLREARKELPEMQITASLQGREMSYEIDLRFIPEHYDVACTVRDPAAHEPDWRSSSAGKANSLS